MGREPKIANPNYIQWATQDNSIFEAVGETHGTLPPGMYSVVDTGFSKGLKRRFVQEEDIVKFPETSSDAVIKEIELFWDKEHLFKQFGLTYKRGILLYGPPGSGKSTTLRLICNDIFKRNGIVLELDEVSYFAAGMKFIRAIEPDKPVVALMEDIDNLLEYDESAVLNLLDGVEDIRKVVFIATTNYISKLSERVLNRPSRFDKRFLIGMPNAESRSLYFQSLFSRLSGLKFDLGKWVSDTQDFSVAHMKELFINVNILGTPYDEALTTLAALKEKPIEDKATAEEAE